MPTTTEDASGVHAQTHKRPNYLRNVVKARAVRDLDPDENEEARALYKELLRDRWGNNDSEAARELGVHPATLNKFKNEKQGTSKIIAEQLRRLAGKSISDSETNSPGIAEVRKRPGVERWDQATWRTISVLETASTEPLTPDDLYAAGLSLEALRIGRSVRPRVITEDPSAPARKKR